LDTFVKNISEKYEQGDYIVEPMSPIIERQKSSKSDAALKNFKGRNTHTMSFEDFEETITELLNEFDPKNVPDFSPETQYLNLESDYEDGFEHSNNAFQEAITDNDSLLRFINRNSLKSKEATTKAQMKRGGKFSSI
jgi:ribosome biogenesis GTPase A